MAVCRSVKEAGSSALLVAALLVPGSTAGHRGRLLASRREAEGGRGRLLPLASPLGDYLIDDPGAVLCASDIFLRDCQVDNSNEDRYQKERACDNRTKPQAADAMSL